MRARMRALAAGFFAAASVLAAACDQQALEVGTRAETPTPEAAMVAPTTSTPEPTAASPLAEDPEPLGDEWPYVVFPEIGDIEVATACQFEGPDGPVYRAELENGGSFQLRKLPDGVLHASAQPSPEADPVGTNVPSDTSFTEDGGWLNGKSLMWLPGTENNITVEYHVRWDRSIPGCGS